MEYNNILNCTPHEVILFHGEEKIIFPPHGGDFFHLPEEREELNIENFPFPLWNIDYSAGELIVFIFKLKSLLKNPYLKNKFIITSMIVGDYISNVIEEKEISPPFHLISPDMERAVRDEQGRILGVRGFIFHI